MFEWLNNLPIWMQVVIGLLIGKTIWSFIATSLRCSYRFFKACLANPDLFEDTPSGWFLLFIFLFCFSAIGGLIWVVLWVIRTMTGSQS